ncbi:SGNH/GDSL hydrolase family protein [Betaproteobacteria bacterium PRO7]|nr:SGNH/GDSL hydrolase family protein [Betaproteobacteria bacterium PRO7]
MRTRLQGRRVPKSNTLGILVAKNLLLLAVSILVAALGSELVARWLFPEWAPRTGTVTQFWQYDAKYGWSHVPGASGRFASFGFDTTVTTNSIGFRGREVPLQKKPSTTRILVLGDSYVWGFGVQDDEVFTSKIERLCPRVEAVNFGVSGYSTDQELLLYRDKGAAYGADVVVLVLAGNDYEDNARSKVYVYYHKPAFVLDDDRLVPINQPVPRTNVVVRGFAWVAQQSYVLTQLNRSIESVVRALGSGSGSAKQQSGPKAEPAAPRPYPRTLGQAITVRLVREMAASVRAAGSGFVVVFTDGQGKTAREFAQSVADPAIAYVYLDDAFPPDEYARTHLPGDFHWNADGHALVARTVARSLIEFKKVPAEACSPAAVLSMMSTTR